MTSAGPATRCRVCNASVPADARRCPSCSAAIGEQPPCPHCRAIAGVSPDKEFRFHCDVCGGPRVPRAEGFVASGSEVGPLKRADAARRARAGWRGGAVFFGLATPFVTALLMLLALMFGIGVGWTFAAIFTLGPLVAGLLLSLSKARAKSREIVPALDAAWVSVATDLARANGAVPTAAELTTRLGIEEGQAEELSALLDVNAIDAPANLRVAAAGATDPGDAAALELAAEEEAAAAEAHAAALAKRTP